jgi:hypothetical protein
MAKVADGVVKTTRSAEKDAKQRYEAEVATLRRQNETLEAKLKLVLAGDDTTTKTLQQLPERLILQEKVHKLHAHQRQMAEDNAKKTKEQAAEIQELKNSLAQCTNHINALESQIAAQDDELLTRSGELQKKDAELSRISQNCEKATAQLKRHEHKIEVLEYSETELKKVLNRKDEQIRELDTAYKQAQSEVDRFTLAAAQHQKDAAELQEECERVQKIFDEQQRNLWQLEKDVQEHKVLQEELASSTELVDHLYQEIDRLRIEAAKLKGWDKFAHLEKADPEGLYDTDADLLPPQAKGAAEGTEGTHDPQKQASSASQPRDVQEPVRSDPSQAAQPSAVAREENTEQSPAASTPSQAGQVDEVPWEQFGDASWTSHGWDPEYDDPQVAQEENTAQDSVASTASGWENTEQDSVASTSSQAAQSGHAAQEENTEQGPAALGPLEPLEPTLSGRRGKRPGALGSPPKASSLSKEEGRRPGTPSFQPSSALATSDAMAFTEDVDFGRVTPSTGGVDRRTPGQTPIATPSTGGIDWRRPSQMPGTPSALRELAYAGRTPRRTPFPTPVQTQPADSVVSSNDNDDEDMGYIPPPRYNIRDADESARHAEAEAEVERLLGNSSDDFSQGLMALSQSSQSSTGSDTTIRGSSTQHSPARAPLTSGLQISVATANKSVSLHPSSDPSTSDSTSSAVFTSDSESSDITAIQHSSPQHSPVPALTPDLHTSSATAEGFASPQQSPGPSTADSTADVTPIKVAGAQQLPDDGHIVPDRSLSTTPTNDSAAVQQTPEADTSSIAIATTEASQSSSAEAAGSADVERLYSADVTVGSVGVERQGAISSPLPDSAQQPEEAISTSSDVDDSQNGVASTAGSANVEEMDSADVTDGSADVEGQGPSTLPVSEPVQQSADVADGSSGVEGQDAALVPLPESPQQAAADITAISEVEAHDAASVPLPESPQQAAADIIATSDIDVSQNGSAGTEVTPNGFSTALKSLSSAPAPDTDPYAAVITLPRASANNLLRLLFALLVAFFIYLYVTTYFSLIAEIETWRTANHNIRRVYNDYFGEYGCGNGYGGVLWHVLGESKIVNHLHFALHVWGEVSTAYPG